MSDTINVFDFWRQCAKHPRAKLDPSRAKVIVKAMSWGYSVAELQLAIYGCCSNPWYGQGANKNQTVYTALTLILRDGDHIDRFMRDGDGYVSSAWKLALEEKESREQPRASPDNVRRIMEGVRSRLTK